MAWTLFNQLVIHVCTKRIQEEIFSSLVCTYVDDIVLAGMTDREIGEVKTALSASFDIKDLGKLHHFLGMNILHDDEKGEIWIGQPIYTENLLKKKWHGKF